MAKEIVFNNFDEMLKGVAEYIAQHKAISERAATVLQDEKDPKKVHESLIAPAEELYKFNVAIRNFFGDKTKECIGPKGSIADLAVNRRKELQGEKKETKKEEPAAK